ncbi:MAG: phage major capsid protein [Acidobacteria bacterium]|nr:phage major capsid protein [Acidobacteriota bacterium]
MPDGKPTKLTSEKIIRKALDARHHVSFVVTRAEAVGSGDDRTVNIVCATDAPITHFLWSKWDYVDIQLAMNTQAMRAKRFESGAAFLMDHNTRDQRGVIESFEIKDGQLQATVRMSRSERGEELYQDIIDGIRQQISLGFMIHNLVLVEERENQPDLYQARDWEPYEASSVAVAADIDAKVMRAMAARRDGMTECPDCEMPIDECTCEPADDTTSEKTRGKRAIPSTNGERQMPNAPNPKPVTDPVVEVTRNAAVQTAEDVIALARCFGDDAVEVAREMLATSKDATVDDFRVKYDEHRRAKNPKIPVAAPGKRGEENPEFTPAGEVQIDKRTKEVLESAGFDLSDKQLSAISTRSYGLAFREYIKKGIGGMGMDAVRALSEGTDSEGGFLVPAEFLAKMVERAPATTSVEAEVTTLQTGSDKLTMPKNAYSASSLYTTGVRVNWVDEKTGPNAEEDATDFGNVTIPIHTAMMYHDVTKNMIEDSQFDILGWLQKKFNETADVVTENMIINGSGVGQPAGILVNPNGTDEPATVVSGSASTVTADGLFDLEYALPGRYTANAKFVFNRLSTEKAIAKLKDSSNRYLFSTGVDADGLAVKRPTELLGYPFISSDFMPDLASNAYPIIFGDLTGYYLVRRIGFSIQVLNEIVATSNKVRVLGRMRIGGQVAEDWKLKIQKCST